MVQDIAGATHQGQRDHNEDCFVADAGQGLAMVADGMGGHAGGEIASGIARDVICNAVKQGGALVDAVLAAHRAIQQASIDGVGRRGMGTTVVAAHFTGYRYRLAWVGDSRAYLWDGGRLLQLTRDHSYVESLLASAAITLDEARHHPQRNLITQALGVGDEPLTVDEVSGELAQGEILLLCSDGLNDELDDAVLARLLAEAGPASADLAHRLVAAAVAAGGHDNVSAVVVRAGRDAPVQGDRPAPVQVTTRDGHTTRDAPPAPADRSAGETSLFSLLAMPLGVCAGISLVLLVLVLVLTRITE